MENPTSYELQQLRPGAYRVRHADGTVLGTVRRTGSQWGHSNALSMNQSRAKHRSAKSAALSLVDWYERNR